MNFFVEHITQYSARANVLDLKFVGTNTKLDGKVVQVYAPKSVELEEGKEQDIPFFICSNIWNSCLTEKNVKLLKSAYQNEAKPGQKRASRDEAVTDFYAARALNIEQPPKEVEKVGQYVGNIGEELFANLSVERLLYTKEGQGWDWRHNGNGWEHPSWVTCLWQMKDENGNFFILRTSSDKINNILEVGQHITVKCTISSHDEFRGMRQNHISVKSAKSIIVQNQ